MSKKKDLFIHGICATTGFVKHWPRDKFYVKDGKVYAKGNNTEPQGVEDQSVLTKASEKVLDEIADNLEKENSDQEQTPTQLPEAEPVVTASQQSEEPSQPTNKEPQMPDNNQATTNTTSEQAKEQTVNEQAQSTATKSTTAAKENQKTQKPMTKFGVGLRITLALIIMVCAILALAYGTSFAVAYIAGLGLSEVATTVLTFVLWGVALVVAWFIENAFSGYVNKCLTSYKKSQFEQALADAELSAA